jgi:hypothetical protein
LILLLLFAGICAAPARADAPTTAAPSTARGREVTLDEYRQHLRDLAAVAAGCAKARDTKTCNPELVGPDDRVPLAAAANAERRLVAYGWLRVLLEKAQVRDEAQDAVPAAKQARPDPAASNPAPDTTIRPPRRTTTELLQDAQARLAQDLAQADAAATAVSAHAAEREAMKQVLAGRDFRNLESPTARDSALEKLGDWLNRIFESVAKLQARSAWVGRVLVGGFILAVCVGLAWGLLQLERRWRMRLTPEAGPPAPGAASARDWQLWLEDARRAAAAGLFREAVHFVYWAAISRLESRRLWPADRARTPREYLALVSPEDPRKPGLATLTGSFERIWYGGRAAGETDYRRAEELAAALISGSGAPEGGAR